MTDNIVARLREGSEKLREHGVEFPNKPSLYGEAADEITRLQADLAAMTTHWEEAIAANSKLCVIHLEIEDQLCADLAAANARAEDREFYLEQVEKAVDAVTAERDAARAELAAARALLSKWDALINYQFSGSREGMSAMTKCAQETAQHLYGPPPWPPRIDALLKGDDRE